MVKAPPIAIHPALDRPVSFDLVTAMGAAMTPVLFAYGGWQTSCFIAGEVVNPGRNMPRALVMGVLGVIGPTRLNYSRIVPMVDFTSKLVGRLLQSR